MKQNPHSISEYLPPPHVVVGAASLESFHPQSSSCPTDNKKLTRREASHFIATAIAAEEDGSEKKKRGAEERIKDAMSPRDLPL